MPYASSQISQDTNTNPDVSQYTSTLDLLAAVPTDPTLPTFIGHWAPPEAANTARHIHMYTQLSAAQIALLQDHKSYGTWMLPFREADFSGFLHREITNLATHSADPEMLSKLSARLAGQEVVDTTQVQLFGIRVLREDAEGWLVPGRKLMWRWVKPESVYRKSGAWETTLEKAVVDGEWSTGKGMVVLVKSVLDEN